MDNHSSFSYTEGIVKGGAEHLKKFWNKWKQTTGFMLPRLKWNSLFILIAATTTVIAVIAMLLIVYVMNHPYLTAKQHANYRQRGNQYRQLPSRNDFRIRYDIQTAWRQ